MAGTDFASEADVGHDHAPRIARKAEHLGGDALDRLHDARQDVIDARDVVARSAEAVGRASAVLEAARASLWEAAQRLEAAVRADERASA